MSAETQPQLAAQITAAANELIALHSRWINLDRANADAAAKLDEELSAKSAASSRLNEQIETKVATHEELSGKVHDLLQHHDQILASIEALRKRVG
ncbi:hypothetical protein [uncultured Bradyrhizobium sp.]|jgi:chromosome segregation ATPase|uniref:hypothetical protein n=1 Tax=uncultured Bradyrhizobium sp. TaxID=199684 RepID=UPI002620F9D2|nr:hypothetical protein [uncultured Bradyrhizobium sp.]